ncbi:hypothetical protein HOY82DRAFT_608465 [Tuber indicum]|nr:hypothetical protein HOY82DRAFT_608465 [Tuber indicum]
MKFTTLTLLTFAAAAAAGTIHGRGSAEDGAIRDFTEKCKSQGQTVICCNKTDGGASKGELTGNIGGVEVCCNKVPSYVLAGNQAQTRAQCGGGLGCCTDDAIQAGVVDSNSGCSVFVV